MNELENINLHEHLVRQSVFVLILKGAFVWLFYLISNFIYELWRSAREPNAFSFPNLNSGSAWNNLDMAALYVNWIIAIFWGLLLLYVVLSWVYEYYIFKIDRIIARQGIIFSREFVYEISNIHSLDISQGLLDKIMNTGTLKLVYGARGLEKNIYISRIPRPYHIASHIQIEGKNNIKD